VVVRYAPITIAWTLVVTALAIPNEAVSLSAVLMAEFCVIVALADRLYLGIMRRGAKP
jgi:hypothetical protein